MGNILQFFTFGGLEIRQNELASPLSLSSKAQGLLLYLASTQKAHSRDFLGDLLWNDRDHERSIGNVRLLLNRLPDPIAPYLVKTRQSLALDLDRCWIDAAAMTNYFEPLIAQRNASFDDFPRLSIGLEQGLALYCGEFLSSFYLSDASRFDEWLLGEQERYRRQVITALRYLCSGYLHLNDYLAVERHTRHWLKIDSYAEDAYRHLMRALMMTGRRNAALAEYEACRRILVDELHITPEAQTTALYETLRTQSAPPILTESRQTLHHNLPPQLTAFIGREAECEQIIHQLTKPDCRLLTIIGLPGIGKTRLALSAAETQLNAFADGVYFVSLASITETHLIVSAIAEATHFAFYAADDLQAQLLSFLRGKTMLLILDNFEHLIDGTGLLLSILAQAPQVKLLITSRERLNVQPEWLLDLRGLPFPSTNTTSTRDLHNYHSVQLFIQTAQRVRADFSWQDEQAELIRICQIIGGMPLGIEMAAAWVNILSCKQIANELAQGLDVLTTTQRHITPRQQNMRAVFEHSWNLISGEEQAILMKLSIFRGGFTIDAANEVANGSLRILALLVDKSLLQPQWAGRFQMHELLRQYADEKLKASGQAESVGALHFAYFSALTSDGELKLHGSDQLAWIDKFETDYDNLCMALSWSATHPNYLQAGLLMAGNLFWFWAMGNRSKEGYDWLIRLLRRPGAEALTKARGWALHGAAALAFFRTDSRTSLLHIAESRYIAEEIGDRLLLGQALYGTVSALVFENRAREALPIGEQAVIVCQESKDTYGIAWTIAKAALGIVNVSLQEHTKATEQWNEVMLWSETSGDQWYAATAFYHLGVISTQMQAFEAARSYQERAMLAYQGLGDKSILVRVICALAEICILQGNDVQASVHYHEALSIAQDQGYDLLTATCLYELGRIFIRQGDLREAKTSFEKSASIYKRIKNQAGIESCLAALAQVNM